MPHTKRKHCTLAQPLSHSSLTLPSLWACSDTFPGGGSGMTVQGCSDQHRHTVIPTGIQLFNDSTERFFSGSLPWPLPWKTIVLKSVLGSKEPLLTLPDLLPCSERSSDSVGCCLSFLLRNLFLFSFASIHVFVFGNLFTIRAISCPLCSSPKT